METGKSDVLDKIEKLIKKIVPYKKLYRKAMKLNIINAVLPYTNLYQVKKKANQIKRFLSQIQSLKLLNALKILRVTKLALICFSMTIKRQ